jgi:hypothetical protein
VDHERHLVGTISGLRTGNQWQPETPSKPHAEGTGALSISTTSLAVPGPMNTPATNTGRTGSRPPVVTDPLLPTTEGIRAAIGRERQLAETIGELREGSESKAWSSAPHSGHPSNASADTIASRLSVSPEPLRDLASHPPSGAPGGPEIARGPTLANPLDELISAIYQPPASLFDEVIATVSESTTQRARRLGPPPPPERFRVRVADVGRPHRTTKRNYDYFEELNASIAARTKRGRDCGV